MWLRAAIIIPLATMLPTLAEPGCDDTDPTPIPTPTPTGDPIPTGSDYAAYLNYLDDLDAASTNAAKEELTYDFLYEISYSGGWPIVEGD